MGKVKKRGSHLDSIHGDAFESHISGKKIALILTPIANPLYLRYVAEIVSRSTQDSNTSITLINMLNVNFEFNTKKTLPGGSDANAQIEILHTIAKTYKEFIDFLTVDGNMYRQLSKKMTENCKKMSDLKEVSEYSHYLSNSIQSILSTTYIKSTNPNAKLKKYRKIVNNLELDFQMSYKATKILLADYSFETVIFLNGRYPAEAAIRYACIEAGKEFLSLEHGMPRGVNYHLELFQTQERDLKQQFLLKKRSEFSDQEIYDESDIWLQNQRNNVVQNAFLSANRFQNIKINGSEVVFFTSSVDENIGSPGYLNDGWTTQHEAIYELGPKLKKIGMKLVVRIHPNALNKAWLDIAKIIRACRITSSLCLLPMSNISSYSLLDNTNKVIVWKSTLGLEANAMKKCVYLIAENDYDEMIDTIRIKPGFSHFPENWDIDPLKSRYVLCYKKNNGFPLGVRPLPEIVENKLVENEIKSKSTWDMSVKRSRIGLLPKAVFLSSRLTPGELLGIIKRLCGNRIGNSIFSFLLKTTSMLIKN